MRSLIVVMFSLLFITAPSASAQGPSPIAGRWDLVVAGTDAPYSSWLEVSQEPGGKLTGRFVGRFGSVRPIRDLSFESATLKFSLPRQFERRQEDLVFEGRLTGQKNGRSLSGTTVGEDGKTLKWSAVPAPPLRASTPKWGTPIQIFNGKGIEGWKLRSEKNPGCWAVEDGAMTNSKGCVDIVSEAKFSDFKLHLEFRMADPAVNGGQRSNSGIYLRGRYEVQIQDDFGKPADSHGAGGLSGFLTPTTNAIKPAGEWQTYDITFIGRQLTVVLNGQTIIDRQEIPGVTGGAIDSAEGTPGPIMLQGDHGKVWFKNIVITPAK